METSGKQRFQILAVDDEPMVLQSIKMVLQHYGHEVQAVASGEAALALFAQRTFDLVITDFSMPGMQGDELVARIKALRPDQPVIMATAFADEFKVFGKPSGGVDFLLFKPFFMEELLDAIDQVVPGKKLEADSGLDFDLSKPPAPKPIPPPEP
jgi:CheY-like chemotaxis protein